MKYTVIHYQAKPEATQRNSELIENVFREAHTAAPKGVHYLVLRGDDGAFFHIVGYDHESDKAGLTGLPAFAAFSERGAECRVAPPVFAEATVVGNYRTLAE